MLKLLDEDKQVQPLSEGVVDGHIFTAIMHRFELVDDEDPLPIGMKIFVISQRMKCCSSSGTRSIEKLDSIRIFLVYSKGPRVMFTTEDLRKRVI